MTETQENSQTEAGQETPSDFADSAVQEAAILTASPMAGPVSDPVSDSAAKPVRKSWLKRILLGVVGAASFLCVAYSGATVMLQKDPPVIYGVPDRVEVYSDADYRAALMEGVGATGEDWTDEELTVDMAILREDGTEAAEPEPGTYEVRYTCQTAEATTELILKAPDREPPVISGTRDLQVPMGGEVSYRDGVTAEDAVDGPVEFRIDASQVDLSRMGVYPVVYSAEDSKGNAVSTEITVTVGPPEIPADVSEQDAAVYDEMQTLALAALEEIIDPEMTDKEMARAIFDYVHGSVSYVGTSNKNSWIQGAYEGLKTHRGDCYTYFAESKCLLTLVGIETVDLERQGGNTSHFWQLAKIGGKWYHFDTCPHPDSYPLTCFLLGEGAVRNYTERCRYRKNYYVYDYDSCPVTVEWENEADQSSQEQTP